jgi:hypothetical protein
MMIEIQKKPKNRKKNEQRGKARTTTPQVIGK